jgi:hypothetical protein
MNKRKLTAARKALIWWFRPPANPYICVSFVVDSTAAKGYLADLAERHGAAVSINHLVTAVVGRVLGEFPKANDRLARGRLVRRERCGLAMPVDLRAGGTPGAQETAMAVLDDVDQLSLVQIAAGSRKVIDAERSGRSALGWVHWLTGVIDRTPYSVLAPMLSGVDWLTRNTPLSDLLFGRLPGAGVTNVGAALAPQAGVLFRGGSMEIPPRLMHVGTIWGVSVIQDEVIPVNGEPQVRPMLPVVFCFDHRLCDGVYASKMVMRFSEIFQEPEREFGADGSRVVRQNAPDGPAG